MPLDLQYMRAFLMNLVSVLILLSCSDGDLQIETIDFDSVTVQTCMTVTTDTEVFFKINSEEALILTLQSGLLNNEASTETITSAVPSRSSIVYRIFNETVTSSYFCSDIPPTSPTVVEEIVAEGGEVLITTIAVDDTTFEHTIQLQGISLVNDQGERITDLTINDFGTVTTTSN
jgi:hypothetical protein